MPFALAAAPLSRVICCVSVFAPPPSLSVFACDLSNCSVVRRNGPPNHFAANPPSHLSTALCFFHSVSSPLRLLSPSLLPPLHPPVLYLLPSLLALTPFRSFSSFSS